MKAPYVTILILIFFSCSKETPSNLTLLDANIPTDVPQLFAKGIVSTNNYEFAITFTPEMDELFFTRRKPEEDNKIYTMKLVDDKWSNPKPAFFTATEGWDFEPHINPKGDKLYFGSTRPLNNTIKSFGLRQWYSKKSTEGWSSPIPLEKPFVDKTITMYLTSAENENLYFTTGEKGDAPEDWVIYKSIKEDGQYKSIDRMGKEINAKGKWIAHSYIAPDESYMIYDFKSDLGFGKSDLYISFNKNGVWTEPHNLGSKINTDQTEMAASVSPDGKYLFFHRGEDDKGDIYWVEFKAIKENLLKNIDSILEVGKTNNEKSYINNSPTVESIYFNEKPPMLIPKLFDPKIVSPEGRFEGGTFSPDMKEFYFTRKNGKYKKRTFFAIRYENNRWGEESETYIKWPQFSVDGKRMYVGKTYRERTEKGWSEPKSQGEFLKDMAHGMSLSAEGNYYFTVYRKEDNGINGAIHFFGDKNEKPMKLSTKINIGKYIAHPFIAPDESYLIWDVVREDGYGKADIYISFKQRDGSWCLAINMGIK
ncbi:hypothetical protein K8354_04355 [Polaribacter litorisediminis]|uniref:hypothetical protein n=1 Tax=Polaribacter litorisediminis TaxID=1908341 RepID=UPI001CC0D999|nr:hypothetical protein [Polaribacter litorisediminis]UAM99062.1 hypothetical protein K8354_04355 [Polaribacter litorisediminis]